MKISKDVFELILPLLVEKHGMPIVLAFCLSCKTVCGWLLGTYTSIDGEKKPKKSVQRSFVVRRTLKIPRNRTLLYTAICKHYLDIPLEGEESRDASKAILNLLRDYHAFGKSQRTTFNLANMFHNRSVLFDYTSSAFQYASGFPQNAPHLNFSIGWAFSTGLDSGPQKRALVWKCHLTSGKLGNCLTEYEKVHKGFKGALPIKDGNNTLQFIYAWLRCCVYAAISFLEECKVPRKEWKYLIPKKLSYGMYEMEVNYEKRKMDKCEIVVHKNPKKYKKLPRELSVTEQQYEMQLKYALELSKKEI